MKVWIVFVNPEPEYGEGYGTYARPLITFISEEQARAFISKMTGHDNIEEGKCYDKSWYDPMYYYLSCEYEAK